MTGRDALPTLESLLAERAWVRSLARGLVACESDVDDVEQETWLAALRSPPRAETPRRAWLAAVVRNQARLLLRRAGRRDRFESAGARAEAQPSTVSAVAHADALRALIAALLALEEPYRGTLLLRYFEGMPPQVIAARTGDPVGTVKTRLRRGLSMLRARLDDDEGRDRRRAIVLLLAGPPRVAAPPATAAGGATMAAKANAIAAAAALVTALFGAWWLFDGSAPANVAGGRAVAAAPVPRRPSRGMGSPVPAADAEAATEAQHAASGEATAVGAPLRRLTGVVVDLETDGAIAGADVRVSNLRNDGSEPAFESCGRTDAEGRFALERIPDRRCKVEVAASGHRPFLGEIGCGPLEAPAAFPLAAGRDLTVFVTGPDGAPMAGVRVEYLSKWGRFTWSLRTDADGAVARAGIERDVGSVTVSAPGFAGADRSLDAGTGPLFERVQLTTTPAVSIEIAEATLSRFGAAATFRFVVSPGWARDASHRIEATADPNGVAELRGLPADRPSAIVAFVSLDGHNEAGPFDVARDVVPGRQDGPTHWDLANARVVKVNCADGGASFDRGTLSVRATCALTDDERRRLEGEAARFHRGASATYPQALAFSANGGVRADGTASLVLPFGSVKVRAAAGPGGFALGEGTFAVDASTDVVALSVRKHEASIAGRVVGPGGIPMAHRAVQACIVGKFDRWTETDESGRFAFDAMDDAPYEVSARGVYDEIGGDVAEGVRVPTNDLELRVGAVTVRGRVRGAGGHRCRVSLFKENDAPGYVVWTWTDAAGAFELRALSPGRWFAAASDGDRELGRWNGAIAAGATDFSFEIESPAGK
jgi:RNA polymerase sigma-70 factor (ECF subfamily)